MNSPYIIIPVHNRRETTLGCLAHLARLGVQEWSRIVVVDDGSTDDTSAAIQTKHPQVHVLRGDGRLWWAGSIQKGIDYAMKQGCTQIIWLNDDTLPDPGTLEIMSAYCRNHPETAASAYTVEAAGGAYSTYQRGWRGLQPVKRDNEGDIFCDATAGNCVCFDRELIKAIGPLPFQRLPQYYADAHYTMSLTSSGYRLVLLHQATCTCEDILSEDRISWLCSEKPPSTAWKIMSSPKSMLYPPARFYFFWTNWGAAGLITAIAPYFRLTLATILRWVIPVKYIRALPRRGSQAWQSELYHSKK